MEGKENKDGGVLDAARGCASASVADGKAHESHSDGSGRSSLAAIPTTGELQQALARRRALRPLTSACCAAAATAARLSDRAQPARLGAARLGSAHPKTTNYLCALHPLAWRGVGH
jgi:hypothetical protein